MESFRCRLSHSENISPVPRVYPHCSVTTLIENLRSLKHANGRQMISDMLASRLKHKQRVFLNDCTSHLSIVESDSSSVVHLIVKNFLSSELHRYRVQRLSESGFEIKDTMNSSIHRTPSHSTDYARRRSVLLFNTNEVISAPRIHESTIPNRLPFCRLHRQPGMTAVGIANAFEESRNLSTYVAKGTNFSFLPLKTSNRSRGYIDFAETSSMSNIFHLQCMLSPNNDRKGVILRRRDGQIEFWEDRQPKKPVVIYCDSQMDSTTQAGHPVIDFPCQSYVAAATGDNETIRLWKLQTGQLVNVMEPEPSSIKGFPFPPVLIFRSFWGFDGDRSKFQGLTLMSIRNHVVDFFF
ncbi:hypothetical protein Aperf_G00000104243 [Anoplocephala perfoliata]